MAPQVLLFVVAAVSLALGPAPGHADSTADNLAKYRALRSRLVTDFVKVGPGPGESQPAPERFEALDMMKWGDGTIALGFYLGVLATEHYLLANPQWFPGADGGDATALERTRDELYHALLAMERLDTNADAAFPECGNPAPALNGFFLRDDVPADFHTNFPGITAIQSDFIDPTLTNKEESQDQVYHVQHGLALVVTLVPDTVAVQGRGLRRWAIDQATRVVNHFTKGDWRIRNPACGNRTVNRGENGIAYSWGEAMAAKFVTAGAANPVADAFWETIWNTLDSATNPSYDDEDNLHMAMAIMAVGDGYGTDTPQVLATLMGEQDWPLYPLIHRALHRDHLGFCVTGPAVNARARLMLDELPASADPSCPGPSGPAPHGFTTHNRFIRGKSQHYVGPTGCEQVRYHGLDYMLLHNLYAIGSPLTWNGDPNADPCAILSDGPGAGGDAGSNAGGGDAGSGDGDRGGGGCCDTSGTGAPTTVLTALALAALLGRRHKRRRQ
ncbi:MAG TPA: hypothetical protein VIU61_06765 [Kofleriaceae bacterium]